MKYCNKCQKEYEDDARFCPECGSTLEIEKLVEDKIKRCPICHKEYSKEAMFCSECGKKLVDNTEIQESETLTLEEPLTNSEVPSPKKQNTMSIVAFGVGLVAVLSEFIPFLGFVVSAAAVALGVYSLNKSQDKTFSIAGIVLGGITLIITIISTIFVLL